MAADAPIAADPAPEPPAPRTEIVVSAATVVKALAIFFGVILIYLAGEALLSIALALVMVLGLDPPVAALERRGWGRGKAALVVFGAVVLIVFVLVVWAVRPLWDDIVDFVGKLPSYVAEAAQHPPVEQLDDATDSAQKLEGTLTDAAARIPVDPKHLLGGLASAVGSVFSLVTLAFLTLFGLIAKPVLTRSVLELMPRPRARHVERTLDEVTRTVSFSLIGNIVISIIAGAIVGVAAVLVDAPNPAVLALIVGLFDLIPQIGSAIAAVIVVTVTLIATGAGAAVVLLAVILVYQQVENYLPGGGALGLRDDRVGDDRRRTARRRRRDPRRAGGRLGEGDHARGHRAAASANGALGRPGAQAAGSG